MELLLVRHAQSSGQAPDAPLSTEGAAQAETLVPQLNAFGPSHLFSSPYARAIATLAPFANETGMDIATIENLRERKLADQDLPDWLDYIERSFPDPDHAAPGGESHRTLLRRILAGLREITATGPARPVLASHGGVISCLFNHIDASFGFEQWRALKNPHLFLVRFEGSDPVAFQDLQEPEHG